MISFYPWQLDAWSRIEGQSAVLAAPTGSGKTLVAYLWAGLLDREGQTRRPEERVIFTAPIKALSNERYLDLRGLGFEVGLETGDFKKNAGYSVLCCTQEIYTLKYAGKPGIRLVVDEFHYIFTDSRRARTYVDGIRATSPNVPILVMSATFGNPEHVRSYLAASPASLRPRGERRAGHGTGFPGEAIVRPGEVRDALVFVFSREGVKELAEQIAGVGALCPGRCWTGSRRWPASSAWRNCRRRSTRESASTTAVCFPRRNSSWRPPSGSAFSTWWWERTPLRWE
jgi:superfamily II RNA helicase